MGLPDDGTDNSLFEEPYKLDAADITDTAKEMISSIKTSIEEIPLSSYQRFNIVGYMSLVISIEKRNSRSLDPIKQNDLERLEFSRRVVTEHFLSKIYECANLLESLNPQIRNHMGSWGTIEGIVSMYTSPEITENKETIHKLKPTISEVLAIYNEIERNNKYKEQRKGLGFNPVQNEVLGGVLILDRILVQRQKEQEG